MSVGVLKDKRQAAGYSQRDLAVAAGVSHNTIKGLERDPPARPHGKTIRALAKALGIRPADLAGIYEEAAA